MKGIVIWAHSTCRSVMGLYRELIKVAGVPAVITLWRYPKDGCAKSAVRLGSGFRMDEFSDLPLVPIGDDYEKCRQFLLEHKECLQLFCDYQLSACRRRLICDAKVLGCRVGVLNEAPCNMDTGMKFLLKEIFIRVVLPVRLSEAISSADFFVNYSGGDDRFVSTIGWPKDKVLNFGYFPPPIEGSRCVLRTTNKPFTILATGLLSKYRGADVLVDALKILKDRGVKYRAIITQNGELLDQLKTIASRYSLPIEFPGRVELPRLIELYESCSVYVGTGRHEPWGMRLNDALNCGAPLVVSRGMGGCKLVDDCGCGLTFRSDDAIDLANRLQELAEDETIYMQCAKNSVKAAACCSPTKKAGELFAFIRPFCRE